MLTFLFLFTACFSDNSASEQFTESLKRLDCTDARPCEVIGGRSSDGGGGLMVFSCRDSHIVPIGEGSAVGSMYSMQVDGSGEFSGGARVSETDRPMRALIERAHEFDCQTMAVHPRHAEFSTTYGPDWRREYDASCWPTTCQLSVGPFGKFRLTKRQ